MIFRRKKEVKEYDKENLIPILHVSICTGETVAGFKNKKTKEFIEVMLIRNDKDLKDFMDKYGITEVISREY